MVNNRYMGFRLPVDLVEKLDEELEESLDFHSRSHLIRTLLEDFLYGQEEATA